MESKSYMSKLPQRIASILGHCISGGGVECWFVVIFGYTSYVSVTYFLGYGVS